MNWKGQPLDGQEPAIEQGLRAEHWGECGDGQVANIALLLRHLAPKKDPNEFQYRKKKRNTRKTNNLIFK